MRLEAACEKLKAKRNTELLAVTSDSDPGFAAAIPEALDSGFLDDNTESFMQRLGAPDQYNGVLLDQLENFFLSDIQRSAQLCRETRLQRFQRINRTRNMEGMLNGIIEDRIHNTLLKPDEEILDDLLGED
jgi:hypothetical protein